MKTPWFLCWLAALVGFAASATAFPARQQLRAIRAICLPGRPLPIVAAELHGTFAKYGVEVQTEVAPNSDALRAGLASGKFDVAHAAVDNAVAIVETAGADVVIVLGGEGSTNELIAQPGIDSIRGLRGRTLLVDAPDTAYALQLKKMLLANGLQAGRDYELKPLGSTPQRFEAMRQHKEYAASMLGPPTSVLAKRAGFVSLGSVRDFIGPYQGPGAFVRREWAQQNAGALVPYLAAYVEAQNWLLAPANKDEVIELLVKEWHLPADVAAEAYALGIAGPGGYQKDARFDLKGFANVLRLRAEVQGQWGGRPPAADKYYDLSYFTQALAKLQPRQ